MPKFVPVWKNGKHVLPLIIEELRPDRLIPNLIAGMIVGIIIIIFSISLASLVFSGELINFAPTGIVMTLLSTMIIGIVVTFFSSFPETIAAPQEVPAAIMALIAASIYNTMPAGAAPEDAFVTIVVTIALTSLMAGVLFLALGWFKAGNLVRFLPYPVVGGFLAGTGWLLITGAIIVMTDIGPGISTLPELFHSGTLLRWLPALIFSFLLLMALNRYRHYLTMPAMILTAVGIFYFVMWFNNISIAELHAQGWLLNSPEKSISHSLSYLDFNRVEWSAILEQSVNVATLIFISVVALLLNASGLELVMNRDIDLNHELKTVGFGNIACGLVGGLIGFHLLSESTLSYKIGGKGRLVGIFVVVLCGIVLFWGAPILYLFPKMLLGSMLMMLGMSFLYEWIYKAWFRFSWIDYSIILTILLVIATVGFLQGVVTGVLMTVLIFVINYSRINVVKQSYSRRNFQSRVNRRRAHRKLLHQEGNKIKIFQLQGFIFFGTANNLLDKVRLHIQQDKTPLIQYIVLDFMQVTGLDSTAMLSFKKMVHLAKMNQIVLVFTNPSKERGLPFHSNNMQRFFTQLCSINNNRTNNIVRIFPDLDYGLEWCENQILLSAGENPHDGKESLHFLFKSLFPDATNLDILLKYFERLDVDTGYYLMKEGDPPGELYFIESGQVTVQLEKSNGNPFRVGTRGVGEVVGEIGFYLNQHRTAAVVTEKPSTLQRLSWQALKDMENNDPEIANLFHQGITLLLAERLTLMTSTVSTLQN